MVDELKVYAKYGHKLYSCEKWDSVNELNKYFFDGWDVIQTKGTECLYAKIKGRLFKEYLLQANVTDIKNEIKSNGWFFFGNKATKCKGITKKMQDNYLKNRKLPKTCNTCYKALLFWDTFSEENINKLLQLLSKIEFEISGKFNDSVVVFYFNKKQELDDFLERLTKDLPKFQVSARVQWRRACKAFQSLNPDWWKNAKEFLPEKKQNG